MATARLQLEPWDTDRDTADLVAMNAEPEVMAFIGEGRPATRAESARQRFAEHWARHGYGLWALRTRSTTSGAAGELGGGGGPGGGGELVGAGEFVGWAGLSHPLWLPSEAGEVEAGWRLRRDAWGHGYASEAARAALELAFGALGRERVISLIRPENKRSRAVAERLGMVIARSARDPRHGHAIHVWELSAATRRGR